MKILFILPRFHINQYFVTKILKEKGHDVYVFARHEVLGIEKRDIIQPEIIEQSSIFRFLNKNIFRREGNRHFEMKYEWPPLISYFKKTKAIRPDVVIIRDPNTFFSFISLCILFFLGTKKMIIYTQGPLYREQVLKTKINKILLTIFNAKWITPVLGDKEKYKRFDKRAYYLAFPVEPILKSFKDKRFFSNENINIISVGKLNQKRKNLIMLLQAINMLRNKFSFKITIIGYLDNEKGEQYLKTLEFIKKHNLSDIVEIKKNLDLFEVYGEYKKNDLFILPSSGEPAAYSIIEAMAAGLPVILSNTNGTSCYIEEGKNGYIFKSDNLNDLTEKIRLIISDRKKLLNMAEKSHELTINNHSPEVFYENFMKIIKK